MLLRLKVSNINFGTFSKLIRELIFFKCPELRISLYILLVFLSFKHNETEVVVEEIVKKIINFGTLSK